MEAKQLEPVEGVLVEAVKQAIAVLDPYEGELTELEERIGTVVYDINDAAQHEQARWDKRHLGKVIARLDSAHAAVKRPLLDATNRLDGRRKYLKDRLLAVQGNPKGQLEAHEAKEKARIDEHFERIQEIREEGTFAPGFTPKASSVESVLEDLHAVHIDDSWEEFKADALLAKTETIEALEKLLAERQKYEAEQAELERLRAEKEERERADREARIAQEATEEAHRKAQEAASMERARVALERQQALEKAERKVEEANRRAEQAVAEERARIEAAVKRHEAGQKAALQKDDERKAQKQYRKKVEAEAIAGLFEGGFDEEIATLVVELIKLKGVPHIHIVY